MKFKFFIKYCIAIVLTIVAIKLFVKDNDIKLLYKVSLSDLLISLLFVLVIYIVSGIRYRFILYRSKGIKLSVSDTFLFPISQNLWSFIIPFQGAILYASAYLKVKYGVRIRDSLSINFFIYSISLVISGIVGILFSLFSNKLASILTVVSFVLILNPAMLLFCSKALNLVDLKHARFVGSMKRVFSDVLHGFSKGINDVSTTSVLFVITIIHSLISVLWFYWTFKMFGFDVPFFVILVYNLFLRLLVLFQLTPGNVGVEELFSAGIFNMLEHNPSQSVIVVIFLRIVTLMIAIPVGTVNTVFNFKHFPSKFKNYIGFRERFKTSKPKL